MVTTDMSTEVEGKVDLRVLDAAVSKLLEEAPGFSGMTWAYRRDVGDFVQKDAFSKSPKETVFITPPAAYYFISQAFQKLPLFCVLTEVAFDRLVSQIVIRAIRKSEEKAKRDAKWGSK